MIAPDYPGFGNSEMPDPSKFAYTFDKTSEIIELFLKKVGLTRFGLSGLRRVGVSSPDVRTEDEGKPRARATASAHLGAGLTIEDGHTVDLDCAI